MLEKLKELSEKIVAVNLPNGCTFAAITFTDVNNTAKLVLTIVSVVSTILITVHTLKKKDK